MHPLLVVVLAVLLRSIVWCIPRLGVSCTDLNSSSIATVTHNTNSGSSSHNSSSSSSSVMLLLHHCSRLPSGHHNSFSPVTFHASTVRRWGTLLENAASPSKATHRELRHPCSINRGANKRVLHNGLAVPTISLWMRFSEEKKC
jgi:hypothetical protein